MQDVTLMPILAFLRIDEDQVREHMGKKTQIFLNEIPAYARQFEDAAPGVVHSVSVMRSQKRLYLGYFKYDDGRCFEIGGACIGGGGNPGQMINAHAVTIGNSGLNASIESGAFDPVGHRLSDIMSIPPFIFDAHIEHFDRYGRQGNVVFFDWRTAYEGPGKRNTLWPA